MTNLAGLPDRDVLAELLLRWEELFERGQDTPAAELAAERPDLASELARQIEALKAVSWMTQPLKEGPQSPEVSAVGGGRLGARYRLETLVGAGGFAEVFRGFDERLQRPVAIKLPRPGRVGPRDAFLAEARRVARLRHEGIVPVYDVGIDGDSCFIVSEFLGGGSLADRLADRRPSPEEALRWVTEVAEALEYAHLHGVVHLDIKPANILIDHHERAKLADFGIAQSAAKSGAAGPSLGTLRYMSPEQLLGKATDHRSDIFSLGIVLHEILTGKVPYQSLEPQRLKRDILAGNPTIAAGLSVPLRSVCSQSLSLDPHRRHASAAEFAAEVRRASGPAGKARLWWPLIAGVLGLIAVTGFLASRPPRRAAPPVGVPTPAPEEVLAEATNLFFQQRYAEAEERYTAYLATFPADIEALTRRGLCRTRRGAFAAAVEDFSAALTLNPDDANLLKRRGIAFASLRQFEPAIVDYEAALARAPSDREIRESFAACYSIMAAEQAAQKEFAAAAELMTKAIAIYPHAAVFYHQRGSCLFHLGEYEQAVLDLDEAIRREPRKPDHYENRGHCYRALGRVEDAEQEFQKAAELRNQ